jgi:putative transposase
VSAGRGLTIERMVELGRVSRSGFYRFNEDAETGPDPDMDLRDAIQRIALEWPSYGRPLITAELRRRGWTVNPKRVYRLLREDNLLCCASVNSSSLPTPTTACRFIQTWPPAWC